MSNDSKTLADVQPGGMVRLGDRPKDGEVLVQVSGLTGSDKSAIAGEIEILCKALGLDAEWVNGDEEKRLTHADWIGALEMYKPKVVIVEQNIPRAALSAQPSPGGQHALASLPLFRLADDANGNRGLHRDDTGSWVKVQDVERALAARQPVASNQVVEDIEQLAVDTQPVVREPVCGTCRGEIRPDSLTGTTCDCAQRYVAENPAGYAECPVTGRPFYGNMEHPKRGLIAMYGGPLDVYSVPELQDKDGELGRERYDLDADCWVEGGEPLGYFYREQQPDDARQPVGEPVGYRWRHSANEAWQYSSVPCGWEYEPLYAAPPAQAVDLGRWSQRHAEDLKQAIHTALSAHAGSLSQKKRDAISDYVKRLLIDSQAVGNG